jgi:hypothetical protein
LFFFVFFWFFFFLSPLFSLFFFFFFSHSVVWKHTRLPDFVLCLGGPRPQIIRARPPPSSTNRRPRRGPANRPRKTRIGDLGAAARRQGRQSREITDHADTKFFCSLFFFSFLFCSSPFLLLHRAAAGSIFVFFLVDWLLFFVKVDARLRSVRMAPFLSLKKKKKKRKKKTILRTGCHVRKTLTRPHALPTHTTSTCTARYKILRPQSIQPSVCAF